MNIMNKTQTIMKFISAVGLILFLTGLVSARSINYLPNSDLVLGKLGPDDILNLRQTNITLRPGNAFAQYHMQLSRVNFTYVAITESGDYPDARASLLGGGPNYDYVDFQLTPGPLGNFNYIMEIWGVYVDGDGKNGGDSHVYFYYK